MWHHISWGHQHKPAAALQCVSNGNTLWRLPQVDLFFTQLRGCRECSSLRAFGVEGPGKAASRVPIADLCIRWALWTCLLTAAHGHDGADGGNLVWAISLLRARCWHSEAALIWWSILLDGFLGSISWDTGGWLTADLDWHDEILGLLLLGGGRENNRVRLIHVITQSWNRSPRI